MAPLVSVLLPTNSNGRWFEMALASILDQTMKDLVVHVLADQVDVSGALDATGADPRVCVHEMPPGRGLARVLNVGVSLATGRYIGRMDADDVAEPDRLQMQVDCLEKRPEAVLVGSDWTTIDEDGQSKSRGPLADWYARHAPDVRQGLLLKNRLAHPTVLMRRGAINAVGGYNERCLWGEDYELWLRLARLGPMPVIPRQLLKYRVHSAQMSRSDNVLGAHTRLILRARHDLARHLGRGPASQLARDGAWLLGQMERSYVGGRRRIANRETRQVLASGQDE